MRPARPFWYKTCNWLIVILFLLSVTCVVLIFYDFEVSYLPLFCIFLCFLIFLLKKTLAKKVKFDKWLHLQAKKQLHSEQIFYDTSKLYFDYDITIKNKDIYEFIRDISNKSNYFTYYLDKVDVDTQLVIVTPVPKQPLPKKAVLDIKDDTAWNIIPFGVVVSDEKKQVVPVAWWLNDQIKREDVFPTIPSSHILIAGSTGSGKSVTQNCIIGHISRFPSHFQAFLCDIKRVEFGRLKTTLGVKKVGVTLEEIEEILTQIRKIMMDRFAFMEQYGVNNIYDIKGKMAAIEINGIVYQIDEIFNCRINGEERLLTAREIFSFAKTPH